jgi:hypothetical protein
MIRTGIAILIILGSLMGWLLLSSLLLFYGNDWWLSGLMTLTIFAWLAGLLVVLFQQGRIRSAGTGAVIASAAYWLLALGPWFGTNVGPSLLTSRGLAQLDVLLHGPPQQSASLALTYAQPQPVYLTGSGAITSSNPMGNTNSLAFINTTVVPSGVAGSVFQPMGHWMLIWLFALVGGGATLIMQAWGERKRQSQSSMQGESPFAAATSTAATERLDAPAPSPGAAL